MPRPARATTPPRKAFTVLQTEVALAAKGMHPNSIPADVLVELDKAESLRNIETLLSEQIAQAKENSAGILQALHQLNISTLRKG